MFSKKVKDKPKKSFLYNVSEITFFLLVVFLIRTVGFGLYQVPTGSMETTMLVGERFFADKLSYLFRSPKRGEIISMNAPTFQYSSDPIKKFIEHYIWGPDNWTKRVIGLPGETIEGRIEDNKPVVYINGVKMEEPYLNKYPLIYVWTQDPQEVYKKINRELKSAGNTYSQTTINRMLQEQMQYLLVPRSYDPQVSFEDQPFYIVKPRQVYVGPDGKPDLIYPGTPRYSNDERVEEKINNKQNFWDGSDQFYIKLGDNQYWMMGDNRLGSKDSRSFGPVTQKLVHGRIVFRIWSIDSDESWWIFDLIKHPIDFWRRVRWSRFFQFVH